MVVNPVKVSHLSAVKEIVGAVCSRHGWAAPLWFETTVEDPGRGQAEQAVAAGATVVAVLGGDGTVRSVAGALIGSGVCLGLLPRGTGNLLARNLKIPLFNIIAAMDIVLGGRDRAVDVGMVSFDNGPEMSFLVMCGAGIDGLTMARVDKSLKKRIGWIAYVVSAVSLLMEPGFGVRARGNGHEELSQHARSVLVGNCGTLTGGMMLMPDAKLDDGLLDAVLVSPRGIIGWSAVLMDILTRHRRGHRALRRLQAEKVEIRIKRPVVGEVDGDPVGECRSMSCRVLKGALVVRCPRT